LLSTGRQEIGITPIDVAAGDYWIVSLFDATTSMQANLGSFPPIRSLNTQTPFASGLPTNFEAAGTVVNDAFPLSNFYVVVLQ
jgi:hypothetical protein